MNGTINSILEKKIAEINSGNNVYETGRIRKLRQYVAEATGLQGVSRFEKVLVGDGSEGYVDEIREDCVVIALTRVRKPVVGDTVTAAGSEFSVRCAAEAAGHVLNIFGEDCLVGKQMDHLEEIPVEANPVSIMDRASVQRPLLTGITGIDLLYPIGRGQRQLILGDRRTGKTQIALDTIFNQNRKGMEPIFCIYAAIGKTRKEIKEIYSQLLSRGSMEYTLILTAFNDDPAPVLRITPYAALSMAEKHLAKGEDVLVVIDDLKCHADVCREIALLEGSMPGRDAYPPDIFYSHSRLLEMGCQHKNGGSITILPICETRGGNITDYISTNIISISDGQIVLSAKAFEKGQKPAIHYGLSVSRLGGAVQSSGMKKAGPGIRRELLSYLEQREVYELVNMDEMGAGLQRSMRRGRAIMKMLCQNRYAVRTQETMLRMAEELGEEE